jgi:hypothetical protein|tara:strand:+ start:551 stop:691 length:141 start_codon:yes stop_codon:yes gene_type:complete
MPSFIAIGNWIGMREAGLPPFSSDEIITELGVQMVTELNSEDILTE